jgi:hypothetical protein
VERPRCNHCRNPIKDHHVAVGPTTGDRSYHEDCWREAGPQVAAAQLEEQRAYQERIASGGLAALLSPYVSVLPHQRGNSTAVPA